MNTANGQAKVDATAAVVAELVAQRKELRQIAMDGIHMAMEYHGHGGMHPTGTMGAADHEGMSCCAGMAEGKGASCCHGEKAAAECTDQDAKTCATAGAAVADVMACCKAHAAEPGTTQPH
jgi:hypothetical protein